MYSPRRVKVLNGGGALHVGCLLKFHYFVGCQSMTRLSITELSRHLHPKFLGQIQSTNIDTNCKSILTCLSNNEKIEEIIRAKCSPPPLPTPLMGLSYGEQSFCRVPPSPVHPHEGAPMRSCCNSFISEAKSLIFSLVGAFLLLFTRRSLVLVPSLFRSSAVVNFHFLCSKSASVLSSCYS